MTILITGGTGLVGSRLSQLLKDKGHKVIHLSRKENLNATFPAYRWDIKNDYIDEKAIQQADAIIHLAGAGIADRPWTKARKKELYDSRIKSTLLIETTLKKLNHKLKVYLATSAMGYYGVSDKILTENMPPQSGGFMVDLCVDWEKAHQGIANLGVRMAGIRIGLVLSPKGGALEKMLLPYYMRLGSYFGDGQQMYSWIHIDDLCRQFIFLLENENTQGYYNGNAPNPVTNKALTKAIATAKNIYAIQHPVPAFLLKLIMGEMSAVLLNSTHLSSKKIENIGFEFKYPEVVGALSELLSKE